MRVRGCQSDTIAPLISYRGHAPRVEDIERRAEDRGSAELVGARRGVAAAQHVGFDNALRFLVVFAKGCDARYERAAARSTTTSAPVAGHQGHEQVERFVALRSGRYEPPTGPLN